MQSSHLFVQENPSVPEIGAEMARLRANFGLTQQEVSDRLHIRARYIAAMESGNFDELPGKVYARGYIHTYAEFLGLDGAQVVSQCFSGEGAVSNIAVHRPPPGSRKEKQPNSRRFPGWGGLILLVLGVLFVGNQLMSRSDDFKEEEETITDAVPDDILKTLRNRVMPTAENKECLTTNALLACFFTDRAFHEMQGMLANPLAYGDPLDVSGIELAPMTADTKGDEPIADHTDVPEGSKPGEPVAAVTSEAQ